LASRKTFTNWLTNRYLLIIRNEENFAEKTTIIFNYAKLILIVLVLFILFSGASLYFVTTVLDDIFDPRKAKIEAKKQVAQLSMMVDSLISESNRKSLYIEGIRKTLAGEDGVNNDVDNIPVEASQNINQKTIKENMAIDSLFRQEFEDGSIGSLKVEGLNTYGEIDYLLFNPLEGLVSGEFDPSISHYGVDIVSEEDAPIKTIADGVVIMSSWTIDAGYVIGIQHKGNLISIYKHNSEILKNVGNFVKQGEIIAIIGNTGDLTTGPHLHFELWYDGNPVNPVEFLTFGN